jgi:N-acetylglucosaminyldiphosphoundecaprenol N-acetyl-beta-D-mannosaminyltransferase
MLAVCEHSVELGYRHFLYGGAEGVPELLAVELRRLFPGLQVVGEYSPPFRNLTQEEEKEIEEMINQADPDIIWVGLGTPKQDLWMAKHRPNLNAPVIIAIGAAFNFHTGRIPQAPAWMQRISLEWLFRLIQEPRRLWYRYLVYNPLFVLKVIEQRLGLRKYQI